MEMQDARAWLSATVMFVFGMGLLVAAIAMNADASTFRAARACGSPGANSSNCIDVREGTIASEQITHARGGDTYDVVIDTGDGTLDATLHPSGAQGDQVQTGAAVVAEVYRGNVTTVIAGSERVDSNDNPSASQMGDLWPGLLLSFLGGAILALLIHSSYPLGRTRIMSNRPNPITGGRAEDTA